MAVPFPIPPLLLAIMGGAFLFVLAGLSIVLPLANGVRQTGYERAVGRELVRLEVILPANVELDADATAELIRALHPGQRRGVDWFRVGWPPIELRFLWRAGVTQEVSRAIVALYMPVGDSAERDDCSRNLLRDAGGRDGAVVEARRRNRRASTTAPSR